MSDWLQAQLDYVYVGYGLAFFFLAIAAWSLQRQRTGNLKWGWLVAFGVIHGANLWLEGLMYGLQWPAGSILRLLLRLISFVCLMEFGRASLSASLRRILGPWLHVPLLAIVAYFAGTGLSTLQAVVRYALGFPAGLLAAWALLQHAARCEPREQRQIQLAAFLMGVYGLLSGLIPALAPWPPASFLNEVELRHLTMLPAQIWRGAVIFGVALLLWWHYRRVQERRLGRQDTLAWWHYLRWGLPFVGLLLALGWVATAQLGRVEDERLRADLLWRARMAAAALAPDHFNQLRGTREDVNNPNYQIIKSQLMALHQVDRRARLYYLTGLRGTDTVFFFADSEPATSRSVSLPGAVFLEASESFRSVFRTGVPLTVGPLPNQWGAWITALAPVKDAQGRVRAVMGMDISADDWVQFIASRRMWPIATVMLLMVLLIGAFIVVQRLQLLTDWLAESEKKYRSLFENSGMAMALLEADTLRVVDANMAAANFFGYPREALRGMVVTQFSRRSQAEFSALVKAAEQRPLSVRESQRLADGTERILEVIVAPLVLQNQRLVLLLMSDVSELVQAERTLQANEERLRKVYDSMTEQMLMGEVIRNPAGSVVNCEIIDCNASFLRFIGKTREEVVGQLVTRVFGFMPPFMEHCAEVVANGQPQHFESFLEPMGIHLKVSLFTPEPQRFALFAADITTQKYGEEQARVQSIALAAAANGIVIMDHTGKVIWTNPAFTAMTGYALRDIQGRTLEVLRSHKHPPEFYAELSEAFRAGRVWSGEIINRRKDGTFYTEAMTVTPVCDSRGTVTHFIEIKQDISEERVLREQFLQAQKMESVGRMAAGIAHDFNNQLQGILGFSDLLRRSFKEEDQRLSDVEQIRKAAHAAANLTRQLMAFGRRQALAMQVVDLNRLIEDGQKMHQRLVGEDINFELKLATDLERIKADPGQLDQILMNLLVNARDAMVQGGRITISTYNITLDARDVSRLKDVRAGRFVVLAVADTGTGIPEHILSQIFEPFFTTKEKHRGTGLGLATVYGIARQHNGWVHVYSQVGKGTVFKIYLPALVSEEDVMAMPEQAVSEAPARGTGQRILLVEDEPAVRELAMRVLRENNYTVVAAENVTEGLRLFAAAEQPFEMVFSDVVLPDGNGLDLIEQLLAQQPDLRVLMASGYTDERSRWPAIVARGLRFIPKPYPVTTLLRTVQEILAGPPLAAAKPPA